MASGVVDADIGDMVAPLVGLRLEIREISKGSEGPEVVPDVVNGAFLHLPLFLRLGDIAGDGGNVEGP